MRGGLGGLGIWLIFWLVIVLVFQLSGKFGLGRGLGPWLILGLVTGLVFGLPTGLITGLLFGLLSGLQTQDYVTPPTPSKAVQESKRNALLSGLPVGLGLGLIGGLGLGLGVGIVSGDMNDRAYYGLSVVIGGLGVGAIAGLQRGGGAYLRHHLLRWLLIRNGFTPRDYVAFLDYASQLILLRRRGGGYEFVHSLLLEHFAALEPRFWRAHASQGSSKDWPEQLRAVDQHPAGPSA